MGAYSLTRIYKILFIIIFFLFCLENNIIKIIITNYVVKLLLNYYAVKCKEKNT